MDKLVISKTDLARFFRVTIRTVTNWTNEGMPRISKGKYDLMQCFKWWRQRDKEIHTSERLRYLQAKTITAEMKLEKLKADYMPASEVKDMFEKRCKDLKKSLHEFAEDLSKLLVNKQVDEIQYIIGEETDNLLRCFCKNGKFVYK